MGNVVSLSVVQYLTASLSYLLSSESLQDACVVQDAADSGASTTSS